MECYYARMKIVIVGAGGVGGYYGATLAKAGHEVFFIARKENLVAIKRRGLTVKTSSGDFTVQPPCGETSEPFGVADLVIVCVKSYDTSGSLGLFESSVGETTAVVSFQNGLDSEDILFRRFGAEKVIGGVCFIGSRVEKPGVIAHSAYGHIAIGELDGEVTERVKEIAVAFGRADIKCKISNNIKRDICAKMIWNVGFNSICAILDCDAKTAAQSDKVKPLILSAMLEWIAVAREMEVDLKPEMAQRNIEVTVKGGEVIPSMLQDRRSGRKMEVDIFNEKVTALGDSLGIDTPVNRTIAGLISHLSYTGS